MAGIEPMRDAGTIIAAELHARAGHAGWEAQYECGCFDQVLDAILKEERAAGLERFTRQCADVAASLFGGDAEDIYRRLRKPS